jgi:hypothetical protein
VSEPVPHPEHTAGRRALDLILYAPAGYLFQAAEDFPLMAEKGRDHLEMGLRNARMVGELVVHYGHRELRRRVSRRSGDAPGPGTPPAGGGVGEAAPDDGPAPDAVTGVGSTPRAAAPSAQSAQSGPGGASRRGGDEPRSRPLVALPDLPDLPEEPEPSASPVDGQRIAGAVADAPRPARTPTEPSMSTSAAPHGTGPGVADTRPAPPAAHNALRGARADELAAGAAIEGYDTLSASQVVRRLEGLRPDELEAVVRHETATRGRRTIIHRARQLLGAEEA